MLAFVIIAGGLIFVFVRYQKRLLQKQQEIFDLDTQHKQDLLLSSIESAEAERMRIAKDIHDEIGSIFSTLSLSVNQLNLGNNLQPEHFDTSKSLIQSGIDSVRRISHSIVPFELELLGLQQTLENHLSTVNSVSTIETHLDVKYDLDSLSPAAAIAVYRMIQELSANCIKYAGAGSMEIRIETNNERNALCISYKDNGIGVNIEKNALKKGIGLKNIESRAVSLNGSVSYHSKPGAGFACKIVFPLNKSTTV